MTFNHACKCETQFTAAQTVSSIAEHDKCCLILSLLKMQQWHFKNFHTFYKTFIFAYLLKIIINIYAFNQFNLL